MANATTLSRRGQEMIGKPLRADFDFFRQVEEDPYDSQANPGGKIALCIAENVLNWSEMRLRLAALASDEIPDWVAQYSSIQGAPEFREAIAGFAERRITTLGGKAAVELSSDHVAVSSGATGIIELSALLLCDEGDVAAFPAPSYPVYTQDVGNKAGARRHDIVPRGSWDATPGVHPLSLADLERSRAEIQAVGARMKMLVLTQPDNPTGAIFTAEQMDEFADWCVAHEVHLCVNELYALSQLEGGNRRAAAAPPYSSFLRVIEARNSGYLHWWYSFSKDFGLSGLRTGVLYSRNEAFLEAFANYAAPSTVSNHTQWLLGRLIRDDEWVEAFAKTNQARLTESYHLVTTVLDELGVTYRAARGSLFVWARLNTNAKVTDEEYWRRLFVEHGVLLTAPGGFGHDDKGWLRIVYSCVAPAALGEAMRRIKVFARQ